MDFRVFWYIAFLATPLLAALAIWAIKSGFKLNSKALLAFMVPVGALLYMPHYLPQPRFADDLMVKGTDVIAVSCYIIGALAGSLLCAIRLQTTGRAKWWAVVFTLPFIGWLLPLYLFSIKDKEAESDV